MGLTGATVITGAGSGLGRELALHFASLGHPLVLMGRRKEALLETAAMLERDPKEYLVMPADVRFPDEVQLAVTRTQERFGVVGILVNNAALLARGPQSVDEWTLFECILRTNIKGPALVSELFVPLIPPGGVIVNVSSTSASLPTPSELAYGASKAGLEQLTRCQSVRYGDLKIRVVGVAPGSLDRRVPGNEWNLVRAVETIDFLTGMTTEEGNGEVLQVGG